MIDILSAIWTKFMKNYFLKQENGKLTEKIFVRRIAVAVLSIVLCISAMGISAYAYFSSSITSAQNTLTAAVYATEIVVKKEGTTEPLTSTTVNVSKNYQLEENATYIVQIKATGSATSGYCKVTVDAVTDTNDGVYYTEALPPNSTIEFKILCEEAAVVGFVTNWGSYSGEASIEDGKEITLKKPIVQQPMQEQKEEEPDNTQQPVTPQAENQIEQMSELNEENQQVGQE